MSASKDKRPPDLYWSRLEPFWHAVSIYEGPEVFAAGFASLPPGIGVLFAGHWCQSEVRNGGFHQFFTNPTGALAPEALDAFRTLGITVWADLLLQAMTFFGEPYPRDQPSRRRLLAGRAGSSRREWDPFYDLDELFYAWLRTNRQTFTAAADALAATLT